MTEGKKTTPANPPADNRPPAENGTEMNTPTPSSASHDQHTEPADRPATAPTTRPATATAPTNAGDPADRAINVVKALYDALERRDMAAATANMVDSASIVVPFSFDGSPNDAAGFEGLEQVIGYFTTVFERMAVITFINRRYTASASGDRVVMEADGDLVLPDGRPYRNRYVFIVDMDPSTDTILGFREYANPVTFSVTFGFPPLGPPTD